MKTAVAQNFLTHGVSELNTPIYIMLANGQCRPPGRLALGDSLMMLGILRNYGKPVELYFDPMPALLPLLESHPLIKDLRPPAPGSAEQVSRVALPRSGRPATWQANTSFRLEIAGATTIDQVKANPILAHSLYYRLPRREDWPSIMLNSKAGQLAPLLSRRKPSLLLFPFNPGRADAWWQDDAWWAGLLRMLRPDYNLIAVGARHYGELGKEVDALLPMNAPESTLPNLAWLAWRAHGFIGRDGGLSHLASALNRNTVTIWDSMTSYRYWAGRRGHHIILSNPMLFRFPEKIKVDFAFLLQNYRQIKHADSKGNMRVTQMPDTPSAYRQMAVQLFGSLEHVYRLALGDMERQQEQAGVEKWMQDPALRQRFYRQSQEFSVKAVKGLLSVGGNWVVPFSVCTYS